jgi:hypothetical protein
MQHPLQNYKIYIFLQMRKPYVTWCQHNLNKVYNQPHINSDGKNVNLGCCITFGNSSKLLIYGSNLYYSMQQLNE